MGAVGSVGLPATFAGIVQIVGGDILTGLRNLANATTIFTATCFLIWWFSKDPIPLPKQFSLGNVFLVLTIVSLTLAMFMIVIKEATQ
jgi:hypothetical protein